MTSIRIQFVKFWKGFELETYAFLELLQKHYDVKIVTDNPEIVIFADRITSKPIKVREMMSRFNCVKVFYTGENTKPDQSIFDFSFSFRASDEHNYFMPIFTRCKYYYDFINHQTGDQGPKDKFCNFVYRNQKPQERIKFCKELQQYKHVECPGEVLNNTPNFTQQGRRSQNWLDDKVKFLKHYKFTIAFENESAPNYVTEKMFDAFYTGSIPIYWGAPNIAEYFDPNSFVNVRDFKNYQEVVEYIREIDNNDELYQKIRSTRPIHNSSKLKECTEENFLKRFDRIVKVAKGEARG